MLKAAVGVSAGGASLRAGLLVSAVATSTTDNIFFMTSLLA